MPKYNDTARNTVRAVYKLMDKAPQTVMRQEKVIKNDTR